MIDCPLYDPNTLFPIPDTKLVKLLLHTDVVFVPEPLSKDNCMLPIDVFELPDE